MRTTWSNDLPIVPVRPLTEKEQWAPFTYRKVEGFEYEEGYVYRLRVVMKKGQYRLVEVVSKEPMVE